MNFSFIFSASIDIQHINQNQDKIRLILQPTCFRYFKENETKTKKKNGLAIT